MKGICSHCGAKMVEYKFGFNTGLAVFLKKLYDAGCPMRTDNLGLTYSQRTNSQKLRYWNLAQPFENKESKMKAGWWDITQAGKDFLRGAICIPKYVIMYRNKVLRYEGETISILDVKDGYLYRAHYQDQARKQLNIF